MDTAMNNGHSPVLELPPVDGASVASSEDYNNATCSSPTASTNEEELTANGMLASTRPKEQTDRFGFIGGKQYTKDSDWNTPVQVIRRREIKWLDMLDDWEKWMSKKPKKVRERCRKGIPCSIRARAWQYLCGSKKLCEQNKARWEELDNMEGDPKWLEIIQKDLDRQFPFHEMFASRDGHGQQDLFRILKAYSIYNPRDGYCQAQAPVAAVLLMHMPAEDAFWALVQICEKYLTGYYSIGLEAVQIDGMVLAGLMKKESPTTHKHMKKHKIDPILYMTEWFMCIFARTLPWPSVLRVWDMFFCEGVKVLFRVALVLLKFTLGRSEQVRECPGLYETMEALRNIPASVTNEDFLAAEMLKLRVFERDMEEEHSLSLARRKVIKERQLAPEKAAAMARDIDNLRKKKRGKVKLQPAKERSEGFGSQDLLAQEAAAAADHGMNTREKSPPHSIGERHSSPEVARTPPLSSPVNHPDEGHVREIHVDNPPKDWIQVGTTEAAVPVSKPPKPPVAEKPKRIKDAKKEEKKKDKADKKRGKAHPKEPTDGLHAEPVKEATTAEGKGKPEKKDKDKKPKSKEEKKEDKKAKKTGKADKKHKDKSAAHSKSPASSPVGDPGLYDNDSPRRMSNGDHGVGRSPSEAEQEPKEFRLSPYAAVFQPARDSHPTDPGRAESFTSSQPSSPVSDPGRSPSQTSQQHDDQSTHLSIGLETPV